MKYLKIENEKGLFLKEGLYIDIDKITKEDLLMLVNSAENDDFEIDPYDETLIKNKAHQIIYENIYNKFDEFLKDKDQFKREVEQLYKDAINKYSVEINDEDTDNIVVCEEGSDKGDNGIDQIKVEDIPF